MSDQAEHRNVAERPTECAILAFRSPRQAERFCRKARWDFSHPRLIYPVYFEDLRHLDFDDFCIITDDTSGYGRFSPFTEAVQTRLEELADHLQVPVIHKDEILANEEES